MAKSQKFAFLSITLLGALLTNLCLFFVIYIKVWIVITIKTYLEQKNPILYSAVLNVKKVKIWHTLLYTYISMLLWSEYYTERNVNFVLLIFFNLLHPDSARESDPKTYLEKAIFDILRYSKRRRIFRY